MSKTMNKYSSKVRERAVRMVLDNEGQHDNGWSAILSVFSKIGCATQTLNEWVKKAEVDRGERAGIPDHHCQDVSVTKQEEEQIQHHAKISGENCAVP